MMKHSIKIFILSLFIMAFLNACKKDKFFSGTPTVSFSTDTLSFDTVFTTIGSTTGYFKIYNPYNQRLKINSIVLEGGSASMFHLNIDGVSANSQTDVEMEAHDSIYVFVSVKVNPQNKNNPIVVYDKVLINTNNNSQQVVLQAYGQDVYLHKQKHDLFNKLDTFHVGALEIWKNDKPHLVLGIGVVDKNSTVTIQQGTKIYLHKNSYLYVYGGLSALGTKSDSIVFQGDRLEHYYDDLPGQWGGLVFIRGCQPCSLMHCIIKNATDGIIAGSSSSSIASDYNISNKPVINLDKCIIKNCDESAVFSFLADITATNSVFFNCNKNVLQLLFGGTNKFTNCTVANFTSSNIQHNDAVLRISNWAAFSSTAILAPVDANFTNCIIYGNIDKDKEIVIDQDQGVGTTYNYVFENCMLRTDIATTSAPTHFINCMVNNDPLFKSNYADMHLLIHSLAIDAGKSISIIDDLDDYNRNGLPDIGAYEFH
ncbi:MAG: hypothetical protein RJA07_1054 [Bacteroidota bacterium]